MIVSFEGPGQDENWSPRGLSSLIAKRQSSGVDVKCLIAPTPLELNPDDASDQSCTAAQRSPSKTPKNHLKAHRRALREKQQNNKDAEAVRARAEENKAQKLAQKKERLYGKVRSRVFSSQPSPDEHAASSPAAGSSRNCLSGRLPLSAETDSSGRNYHIAFGKKIPISAPTPRPNSSVETVASSESGRHKHYGKVPSYITDRKAKIQQMEEERQRKQENAPPAPGLVLMKESERIETLRMLDKNEKEAREALSNIPFSMNHQRAARLREAIEFRLKEIEDTRIIFSKDKVFVAKED
ncbi:hypothetical protein ACHAWF_016842 [Thalassiosira exigua]